MQSYIISKQNLERLVQDSLTLTALDSGGVDNWSWYGQSIKDYLNAHQAEEISELIGPALAEMEILGTDVNVGEVLRQSRARRGQLKG